MIVEAINKILSLAGIQTIERGANIYTLKGLTRLKKPEEQLPEALDLHTLTGLVDYVQKNIDGKLQGIADNKPFIHIRSPHVVQFVTEAQPANDNERWGLADSNLAFEHFQFGHWYRTEDFIVALRSLMVPTAEVDEVVNMVSNVAVERVKTLKDNGCAQTLTIRIGIRLAEEVEVKNPVLLTPYRTFPEVPQPASLFVLRFLNDDDRSSKDEYKMFCALFEADGGAWRIEAIENIKKYFAEKLPDIRVVG